MNHDQTDHNDLESLLRSLSPAAPSPTLAQRVDEELKLDMSWLGTTSSRREKNRAPRWVASASWAALGAAAAIAIMSYLPAQSSNSGSATLAAVSTSAAPVVVAAASEPAPDILPASTLREWENAQDDGIYYVRGRKPEKHVIVISRELQAWADPRYRSRMTVEIPSQQKLVLPVSF